MRKMLVWIAAAMALSVALAGCSEQSANAPNIDSESASVSDSASSELTESAAEEISSSFLAGEESETAENSTADTDSTPPKAKSESSSSLPSTAEKPVRQTETTQQPTSPPVAEQPKQETPTSTPTTLLETEQQIATQPPTPTFEISTYVAYAQGYGQSIGLTLDSTATACWDNPISASEKSIYLERDLRDFLDWYKASGFTAFWVWSENIGNGAYQIYIGYA